MSTRVNRGLAWIGIASSLVGVLDFLAIVVILNTWVSKEEYGIATKAVWIFPILDQATDLGLTSALIQRDDHSESKISTVFWISFGLGAGILGLLVLIAPVLARHLFGHAIVGWMMIAYGAKLVLQNAYAIPVALMKRELRFKELSVIRILANVAEFVGKVVFAAVGFGIWCFVLGPLCRVLVTAVGAQLRHPYRPRFMLKLAEAREYVTFGLKASGSQILFYFYTNVDYPIVGYFFGDAALGVYRMAYEFVLEPVRMISNIVVDIAFPAFARLRHVPERLSAQLVSFTKLNLITVMAYSAVVFVAATDVFLVVFPSFSYFTVLSSHLTPTHLFDRVPSHADTAVRILCAVAVLRSVSFVMPPLLDGVGRPDRTFAYMFTAAIAMPLMFILGAVALGPITGWHSVPIAWAIGYPIAFAVLVYLTVHTLRWSAVAYVRSVIGVAACMVLSGAAAAAVHYALGGMHPALRLIITTVVVVIVAATLLAYTQGLSLRTARRALKGDPADGPD